VKIKQKLRTKRTKTKTKQISSKRKKNICEKINQKQKEKCKLLSRYSRYPKGRGVLASKLSAAGSNCPTSEYRDEKQNKDSCIRKNRYRSQ